MTDEICPDCNKPMLYESSPDIKYEFCIFGYTVQIWDFNHKDWICLRCMIEKYLEPESTAYEQGCDDGYKEAYNKYGRDNL